MNRILLLIIAVFISAVTALANYTLYNFSGNISIIQRGKTITPEKGMTVSGTDDIYIGPGASVEIYNATTKEIFKSTDEGKTTVMSIMLSARKQAGNTIGAINDRWANNNSGGSSSTRLYTEGLVKKSMNVYDPAAENKEVDPHQLALHIYNHIRKSDNFGTSKFPTEVISQHPDCDGLNFKVANSLAFPVYMNVIKFKETALDSIQLSELGQPISSYVILPGQSIAREQLHGLNTNDSHILILTYCRFDIDKLIEETNNLIKETPTEMPDADLPVYLGRL